MLLSSLRETASALANNATTAVFATSSAKQETVVAAGPSLGAIGIEEVDDEESTAEVNIND
jgi:hypothetical protein